MKENGNGLEFEEELGKCFEIMKNTETSKNGKPTGLKGVSCELCGKFSHITYFVYRDEKVLEVCPDCAWKFKYQKVKFIKEYYLGKVDQK